MREQGRTGLSVDILGVAVLLFSLVSAADILAGSPGEHPHGARMVSFASEWAEEQYGVVRASMRKEAALMKSRISVVEETVTDDERSIMRSYQKKYWLKDQSIRLEETLLRAEKRTDLGIETVDNQVIGQTCVHVYDQEKDTTISLTERGGGFIYPGTSGWKHGSDMGMFGDRLSGYPVLPDLANESLPEPYTRADVDVREEQFAGAAHLVITSRWYRPDVDTPVTSEVWVCPSRGYTPVSSKVQIGDLLLASKSARWQHVSGVWAMISWEHTQYRILENQSVQDFTRKGRITDLRVNCPVDDALFDVKFPDGTRVEDRTMDPPYVYVTGKLDEVMTDAVIDELVAAAAAEDVGDDQTTDELSSLASGDSRDATEGAADARLEAQQGWLGFVAVGGLVTIMAVSALVFWFRLRRAREN